MKLWKPADHTGAAAREALDVASLRIGVENLIFVSLKLHNFFFFVSVHCSDRQMGLRPRHFFALEKGIKHWNDLYVENGSHLLVMRLGSLIWRQLARLHPMCCSTEALCIPELLFSEMEISLIWQSEMRKTLTDTQYHSLHCLFNWLVLLNKWLDRLHCERLISAHLHYSASDLQRGLSWSIQLFAL